MNQTTYWRRDVAAPGKGGKFDEQREREYGSVSV